MLSAARTANRGRVSPFEEITIRAAAGGGEYFDYMTLDNSIAARVSIAWHGSRRARRQRRGDRNITGLKRNHGVAIVAELGRRFISGGDAGQAVIFDLKTLKNIGR